MVSKTVSLKAYPRVGALPTPSAALEGVTVELSTDKKPYYCDGTSWTDLSSGGASISVGTTEPVSPAAGDLWVDTN